MTNSLDVTPATWTVGQVPTAANMNIEIRDKFTDLQAGWVSYAPSWNAAGTAPSLGNGVLVGRYKTVGKTALIRIALVFGSTTSGGYGYWSFGLPSGIVPQTAYGEQWINVHAYLPNAGLGYAGNYTGQGWVMAAAIRPDLPTSLTDGRTQPAQNSNNAGASGTSVPYMASGYAWNGSGSNLNINGVFEIA